MGDKPGMPPELMALMQRYNQLGRLLPKVDDDLDLKNPDVRAEVKMIITEMNRVKAEIDAFLAEHGAHRTAS